MVKAVAVSVVVATRDPVTATPRAEPTWRLVEAIAAATPACARGIPVTAVFDTGAFTIPNPSPTSA